MKKNNFLIILRINNIDLSVSDTGRNNTHKIKNKNFFDKIYHVFKLRI